MRLIAISLIVFFAASCALDETPPEEANAENQPVGELEADQGKFDSIPYKIKDFFRHTKELALRDLVDRTAGLATEQLNDLLGNVPYADIEISETSLYGMEEGFDNGSKVRGLPTLKAGLTQRYGQTDFVTQINAIREQHLTGSDDTLFAESEFQVTLSGNGAFAIDASDVDVILGFNPSTTLTSRVVSAFPGNISAVLKSPLASAKEARGWILPRSLDDLKELKPGEAIALSGKGVLGANIAANIPIFSFDPVSHLVLSARFSLGAHVQFSGILDVQLVRGEADILYADVGVAEMEVAGVRVGIQSGWGLTDIPEILEVSVAGHSFALGDIAEKVVKNYINDRRLLHWGVEAKADVRKERMTINRFQINLNGGGDVETAVAQLVAGDLRLAQALADRPGSGVKALVSVMRSLGSQRRYLGAHISGMRFFSDLSNDSGTLYVEDGRSATEILFDVLKKDTGKFFTKWGFRRLLLLAQEWEDGIYQGATANLRLEVSEADKFGDRDQVLDHVDAALLSVMGFDALYHNLTREYEVLQQLVDLECDECDDNDNNDPFCESDYQACVDAQLTDAQIVEWRADLETITAQQLANVDNEGFNPEFAAAQTVAQGLLDVKLDLSTTPELHYAFSSIAGRSAILSSVRITQAGLDSLLGEATPGDFEERLREVLALIVSKRSKDADKKFNKAQDWLEDEEDKLEDMREMFQEAQKRYIALDELTGIRVDGANIGNGAYILSDAGGDEINPAIFSLAEMKGAIASQLFEDLVERADNLGVLQTLLEILTLGLADALGFESHHLVAYTLGSLVPAEHREWLFTADFEEDAIRDARVYSRGSGGGFIEAGQFNLDSLIK